MYDCVGQESNQDLARVTAPTALSLSYRHKEELQEHGSLSHEGARNKPPTTPKHRQRLYRRPLSCYFRDSAILAR